MKFNSKQLNQMSGAVAAAALFALRHANSGHVGIVLGASDIITTVYANHLKRGRDEFIMSAGHGSALLYSVLKLSGYKISDLKKFRKSNLLPGHPEYGIDGVTATTGPLGQGVGNAVGLAMAKKISKARSRRRLDDIVYCLCSDGDLMEGVAQEAIAFAGRYKLNNLIMLWDDNKLSIDGQALTDIDVPGRMRAAGWDVITVDGNDVSAVNYAIATALKAKKPAFIQCKTTLGLGSLVANTNKAHGFEVSDKELAKLEADLTSVAGIRLWEKVAKRKHVIRKEKGFKKAEVDYLFDDVPEMASTRELSGKVLEELVQFNPMIIGGSADLATSTNTKTSKHQDITPDDFSGNFINYGVREHAMAAIMSGLYLGGFRPYGGTFLVFSDYMRPAIRLAAIMKLPVVYVFTHDSVALGEDGKTHQPVEHIASLRLIPNLNVLRPCNMAEVIESWEIAMAEKDKPTCIILSRQKFLQVATYTPDNIKKGAYIIQESRTHRTKMTIIATGSEVPLAADVANRLGDTQVVSMPSVEKFREQDVEYKKKILKGKVVVVEAGAPSPWFEFADAVFGVNDFGLSAPGDEVYKSFGFDAERLTNEIRKKLK